MKMEMCALAPAAGRVRAMLCRPGHEVRGGQRVAVLQTEESP
jgi:biotin carboxyl carrier protein